MYHQGLHIIVNGDMQCLAVDNIVIFAGQDPRHELAEPLRGMGKKVHRIAGADVATEIDARRAIARGIHLALTI